MKDIRLFFYIATGMLLITLSCRNEDNHYLINKEGEAPAKVTNIQVEALPGAARITYDIPPNSEDLLFVKARAELKDGKTREVTASYYTNSLFLDGFGDTTSYQINLYSVGRNGLESEPVKVTVKPKTPPVYTVYESIVQSIQESFGGIRFKVDNPAAASVRIYVETPDSLGNWMNAETFYTSAITDKFSVRGYDTTPREFAIYVRDRWDNISETFTGVFNPQDEVRLDKEKFRPIELGASLDIKHPNRDMTNTIYPNRVLSRLWDDAYNTSSMYHTQSGVKPIPHSFTIDLGVKTTLSRVLIHCRVHEDAQYIYNAGHPKEWEIFGSMDPNPDGSWDGWIPLMDGPCVSFKPSGLPVGQINDEDYQRQVDGEDFEFDATDVEVRYIRVRVNSVWGGPSINYIFMAEMTLFGSVLESYR